MSPAAQDIAWWTVIGSASVAVWFTGSTLTHVICDAETLVPRVVRDLPTHAQQLAADAVAVLRQALLWAAISLLLLASPHTPKGASR